MGSHYQQSANHCRIFLSPMHSSVTGSSRRHRLSYRNYVSASRAREFPRRENSGWHESKCLKWYCVFSGYRCLVCIRPSGGGRNLDRKCIQFRRRISKQHSLGCYHHTRPVDVSAPLFPMLNNNAIRMGDMEPVFNVPLISSFDKRCMQN